MTQKARGRHYFGLSGYPIAAVRVRIGPHSRISHPHDLTEREHDHDFRELVIVIRGEAKQRLQGRIWPVERGDVYILQERTRHHFFDIRELEIINVMYDPRRIPLPMDPLRRMPGYNALFSLEPHFRKTRGFAGRLRLRTPALDAARAIGEAMIRETQAGRPGGGALLVARLIDLITFLSRQYETTRSMHARELLRIGNVIGALERDFARRWTVEEMADMAGMTRRTFQRVFRESQGLSPLAFVLERRLREAERLLRETGRSITDIAFECGFSDGNYFARQFRRRRGLTPSAYRCS